jgi:hypothetical protein
VGDCDDKSSDFISFDIYIIPKIVPIYLTDGKCKTTRHIKIVRGQDFKIFVAA